MAAPFEKRPTLREYLEWARSQGCTDRQCLFEMTSFVELTTPDGAVVPIVDIEIGEGLTPTHVSWLNRRTGLTCPWSGIPQHP